MTILYILLVPLGIAFIVGIVIVIVAAPSSPIGFEDADGFHEIPEEVPDHPVTNPIVHA